MEFIALYRKAVNSFPSAYRLTMFVYADSLDHAKDICSKFYIEHYVLDGVAKSVNND